MEYISMERAEAAWENYRKDQAWIYGMPGLKAHPCFLAGYNAAIADYLKTVVDGVELPELVPFKYRAECFDWDVLVVDAASAEQYARQAIAPYAERLKQAEDVLRMARDVILDCGLVGQTKVLAAINQQLGEVQND